VDVLKEGEELRLRRARLFDVPTMVALERAAFSVHQIGSVAFRRLLARNSALVLVCERGQEVLGHAVVLFRARSTVARLYSIAVQPSERGRGTGRALLTAVVEQARERGLSTLSLEVRALDAPVLSFYERFGFCFKARLPGYYDDGAEAVRLVLALTQGQRPLRRAS
jgi:ribosomal protein S18 acetylase RimI-like enzyme